ncbi:hypothetical protein HXX76_015229 [Chlamydomonas incerta]|uniref:Uncharacterized protein n=1 Tax=Chlamydomonas incerta TaxID=51695 RepID=A0A835SPE5_CHLIN|nr:hypothetical protein HXX76_015229 [Chlamydomonas incerta]|eukprot:KAG2423591.1 hypothetical protein HXX76_015229 [Chlamydomonas incerta]
MEAVDTACHWKRLNIDLIKQIAAALHPNEVATGLKLTDVDTAAALRDSYKTIYLAQPRNVCWEDVERPHRAQQPWPGPAFVAHWGRPEPWRALTLPQRRRLLCLAASSGHAGSLEAALAQCGCALMPEVLTAAAAAGNAAGCERLRGAGVAADWRTVTAAAEAGHLAVLHLLLAETTHIRHARNFLTEAAARGACAGGHADILAWLQQVHGFRPSLVDIEAAARAGQVGILEQLLPPPPPPPPQSLQAQAAAEAGDGDRFRLDRGLLWGPDAAAGAAPVQHPSAQRWHAENRLRLLQAIVHGCPMEVLQRHYEPLSRGWVPARAPDIVAAALAAALAARGGGAAGGAPELWRSKLLASALQSPTACWGAKLDFLLSAWGPQQTTELIRDVAACQAAVHATTESLDCLQRLRWLRAHGARFGTRAAELVSQGGHAEALAYLWDECGVPGPMGTPDPVGEFLRGCGQYSQTVAPDSERGTGARHLRVLQLLATRGAVLSAEHAAMAARCRAPEPMLLYLAEAAVPVAERGGDLWDQAFTSAAQQGASLTALRVLRQRRGAAVDLAAVACGGSEEALDWAAVELAAAGCVLQPLDEKDAASVAGAGNTAAMGWLRGRGLLPPLTSSRTTSAAAGQG